LSLNQCLVSHLTQRLFVHYQEKTANKILLFYLMQYYCLI